MRKSHRHILWSHSRDDNLALMRIQKFAHNIPAFIRQKNIIKIRKQVKVNVH